MRLTEKVKQDSLEWASKNRPDIANDPDFLDWLVQPHLMPYISELKHEMDGKNGE